MALALEHVRDSSDRKEHVILGDHGLGSLARSRRRFRFRNRRGCGAARRPRHRRGLVAARAASRAAGSRRSSPWSRRSAALFAASPLPWSRQSPPGRGGRNHRLCSPPAWSPLALDLLLLLAGAVSRLPRRGLSRPGRHCRGRGCRGRTARRGLVTATGRLPVTAAAFAALSVALGRIRPSGRGRRASRAALLPAVPAAPRSPRRADLRTRGRRPVRTDATAGSVGTVAEAGLRETPRPVAGLCLVHGVLLQRAGRVSSRGRGALVRTLGVAPVPGGPPPCRA